MDDTVNPCNICGKIEFINRDGFFFCLECGTQAEHVQEIAAEDEFIQAATRTARKKVKSVKKNEFEPTSWELVNYILVGLVGELNVIGAKDDLKLKTFQLWAEFLRKNEVAFFKPKTHSLPKLNASFKPRDAKILYNLRTPKRKRKSEISSKVTNSFRDWKKQKVKYDRSEYEKSMSEAELSLSTLLNSSRTSSCTTVSRGIKLNFRDSARKLIKKTIHPQHLKRHENNSDTQMDCKCIPIKKSTVNYEQRKDELFNRRTVFGLLYVALNLIDDKIQLFDLVRFMREGNLSSRKFGHFFPENIRWKCEQILSGYDFPKVFTQSAISIRRQSAVICNLLSIRKLNTPNINSLVERFCKDFMLPHEIVLYVGRLINFFPPKMEYLSDITPFYEGRALAYIIFILKLLFGLDDVKEEKISESARKTNKILENIGKEPKLFVWTDWMRYVETRKLILSRYNLCFCDSNKDFKNLNVYLDKLIGENLENNEEDIGINRGNVFNMSQIFETFLKDDTRTQPHSNLSFITFTPQIDYFERILYDPPEDIIIQESLKFDHSLTEIKHFLNPRELKKTLRSKKINMQIFKEKGSERLNFVETFSYRCGLPEESRVSVRNIEYLESVTEVKKKDQKTNQVYSKLLDTEFLRLVKNERANSKSKKQNESTKGLLLDPKKFEPRTIKYYSLLNREFGFNSKERNIFSDLSDSSLSPDNVEDDQNMENNIEENLKFSISDMKYWILHGKLDIKEEDFKNVKGHMPRNFLWLLETFSSYLETDIELLYQELVILENHYFYKLDDIDRLKNIFLFKDPQENKKCSKYSQYFAKFW